MGPSGVETVWRPSVPLLRFVLGHEDGGGEEEKANDENNGFCRCKWVFFIFDRLLLTGFLIWMMGDWCVGWGGCRMGGLPAT